MIKIRYADLPSGLHVRTEARGKDTIIYLLPGLTVEQRRAALRRVRSSARVGQGPPLSRAGLARAVVADRMMTTVRNMAGALRVHPAMFVPLIVILLSAAVAYFVLSSVSIKIHSPQVGAATLLGPPIAAAAAPSHGGGSRDPDPPGGLVPGRPSPGQSVTPTPTQPGGGHPSPSPFPSPDPVPTGPGQQPSPLPSPDPSPAPSPSTSAPSPSSPSPSPTKSGGGLCVDLGPLGVCVTL